MTTLEARPLSLEEFPYEYIRGQIIQKPMPQGKHSTLQLDLGSEINRLLKPICLWSDC